MVWEYKCATIVMLTKCTEGGRVKCHKYWPSTGAELFGQYQVILQGHTINNYTLRDIEIVDTKASTLLLLLLFLLLLLLLLFL